MLYSGGQAVGPRGGVCRAWFLATSMLARLSASCWGFSSGLSRGTPDCPCTLRVAGVESADLK